MSDIIGFKTKITYNKKGNGNIKIYYESLEQYNFLINKLESVFKIIKDCQNGHDINKFLKSKISRKDFKRLN